MKKFFKKIADWLDRIAEEHAMAQVDKYLPLPADKIEWLKAPGNILLIRELGLCVISEAELSRLLAVAGEEKNKVQT